MVQHPQTELQGHGKCNSSPLTPTSLAGIIDQDDFSKQVMRRAVYNAVHRPKQSAPGFVVEHDDHACVRELVRVDFCLAPANTYRKNR